MTTHNPPICREAFGLPDNKEEKDITICREVSAINALSGSQRERERDVERTARNHRSMRSNPQFKIHNQKTK